MNYIDTIARKIGEKCRMPWQSQGSDGKNLLRTYALLALTTGGETTSENVHDAWSSWRVDTNPDHGCLVEFHKLDLAVQRLDDEYRDAILLTVFEIGYSS